MNNYYMLKTVITIVFLIVMDFGLEYLIVRKIRDKKKSIKWRIFLRWGLFALFLFAMGKIWVDGVGYFFTFIGIIAAALTITQKEYLMNFVGWLIIMWRQLFVEGDYIEIREHSGYVIDMGPLYFTIEEASDASWGNRTGRIVKIPNALVATQPILSYPVEEAFIEGRVLFVFTFDSSVEKLQSLVLGLEREITHFIASLRLGWSLKQQENFADMHSRGKGKAQCLLRVRQEKPLGIQLRVRFWSLKTDQKKIEDVIFGFVMKTVQTTPELTFSLVV